MIITSIFHCGTMTCLFVRTYNFHAVNEIMSTDDTALFRSYVENFRKNNLFELRTGFDKTNLILIPELQRNR